MSGGPDCPGYATILSSEKIKFDSFQKHFLTLGDVYFSFRVMVLEDGQIKEFDRPQVLLDNTSSRLYHLANEAGITLNEIYKVPENNNESTSDIKAVSPVSEL